MASIGSRNVPETIRRVIAHKAHVCQCGRFIAIGERYERTKSFEDYQWRESHRCLKCAEGRDV